MPSKLQSALLKGKFSMQILLSKPYETTPEDLYPIIQNLINQLINAWELFWGDSLRLIILPAFHKEVVDLSGGRKTMVDRQEPAARPENLLIEFFGQKIGTVQIVQFSRYPSKSRVIVKLLVSEKYYLDLDPDLGNKNAGEDKDFHNRLGGYNQAFSVMNYLVNGIKAILDLPTYNEEFTQLEDGQKLVFKFDGHAWHLEFGRVKKDLQDMKGLHYIHILLRHPNKEILSTELVQLVNYVVPEDTDFSGTRKDVSENVIQHGFDDELSITIGTDFYSKLDSEAVRSYKQRISEIEGELEILQDAGGDTAEMSELLNEKEQLSNELLNVGRNIIIPSIEKARQSVTQSISRSYKRIRQSPDEMIGLVGYLSSRIKCGIRFLYTHDPKITLDL
jgi:hypothetical protein